MDIRMAHSRAIPASRPQTGCSLHLHGAQTSREVRRTALSLLCALALACLGMLLPARVARAETSAELSDDGQDYGWLYRQVDYYHAVDSGAPLFIV